LFVFARWQKQFALHVWMGARPQIFPSGQQDATCNNPHLTQCVSGPWLEDKSAKWHQNPSNGLSRMHECDTRQTDHATEKCVALDRFRLNVIGLVNL